MLQTHATYPELLKTVLYLLPYFMHMTLWDKYFQPKMTNNEQQQREVEIAQTFGTQTGIKTWFSGSSFLIFHKMVTVLRPETS